MRKTVTLPDGTTEVLEGTPEEIAAHERLVREGGKPKPEKKKDVLKGKGLEDLVKKIQEADREAGRPDRQRFPWTQPMDPVPPPWFTPPNMCPRCYNGPCMCPTLQPTIIYGTFASDRIEGGDRCWMSEMSCKAADCQTHGPLFPSTTG